MMNHIHHLGWGELSDMGGVYCLGKSEGTSVSNNVIHHVYSYSYGGWGLYTDEGSTGITMENNLVYQCKNSGFHQHYGKENFIRNNIFAGNIRGQLQATRIEDHISFYFTNNIVWYNTGELLVSRWDKIKLIADYNCYWDDRKGRTVTFGEMSFNEWKSSGKDTHSIVANPKIDPDQGIYWPMNKSVLRKIDFKVFDPNKAGVYGSEAWKKKAQLDPQIEKEFEEMINIKEQEENR
ncbi:MAG: right-handed parallel beta-helix repeat-containing protein [Cyclobacteriaceae bacterium]